MLFRYTSTRRAAELEWDLPIHKKCMIYIGEEKALAETDKVSARRAASIRSYLQDEGDVDSLRIRFISLPEDSLITHRSNSIFNIGFWVEE